MLVAVEVVRCPDADGRAHAPVAESATATTTINERRRLLRASCMRSVSSCVEMPEGFAPAAAGARTPCLGILRRRVGYPPRQPAPSKKTWPLPARRQDVVPFGKSRFVAVGLGSPDGRDGASVAVWESAAWPWS